MKAEATEQTIIELTVQLTKTDARLLMEMHQNYLGEGEESDEHMRVRRGLFEALHKVFYGVTR